MSASTYIIMNIIIHMKRKEHEDGVEVEYVYIGKGIDSCSNAT